MIARGEYPGLVELRRLRAVAVETGQCPMCLAEPTQLGSLRQMLGARCLAERTAIERQHSLLSGGDETGGAS